MGGWVFLDVKTRAYNRGQILGGTLRVNSVGNISIWVEDAERLIDCVLSRTHGGAMLDRGVNDLIRAINPDFEATIKVVSSDGLTNLRQRLSSGETPLIESGADLVVLSLAGEVERFVPGEPSDNVVASVRADLVACVELIKEKVGARVFVANLSTLDPDDPVSSYAGRAKDPFVLIAHRLNLMLLGVSHDEGISVVDIDRKIAEVGGGESVIGVARYNSLGCATIAEEIVRIIEDYGFLDDRPLMEQIGARAGTAK
jgi:hypothetical protein